VTVVPAFTVIDAGEKAKPLIDTALVATLVDVLVDEFDDGAGLVTVDLDEQPANVKLTTTALTRYTFEVIELLSLDLNESFALAGNTWKVWGNSPSRWRNAIA